MKKMDKQRKEKLEANGWRVGSVADFLELTPEESALVELRLVLSRALKDKRLDENLTQNKVAKLLKTSQSRIAKMEAGDSSVSLDLLIRSLFSLGIDTRQLSAIIAQIV